MTYILPFLSGLNVGYSWLLTFFRFSTYELSNPLLSVSEAAVSTALTAGSIAIAINRPELEWASALCVVSQFFISKLIHSKYVAGKMYNDKLDLSGKVYIVTGSNTGIGFETVKGLVKMGATVVMACRSTDKALEARTKILIQTKCPASKLIVLQLDLCSFDSVRKFVQEFNDLKLPLHCLINNAGVMTEQRMLTKNGMETVFTANHLSHFLLTCLLLPSLEQTGGRVVTVTSSVHNVTKTFNFDDIMSEKYYEMFATYGQSKLANILFTKELQRRALKKDGNKVKCFSVHPGCVRTEVTRNMSDFMQWGNAIAAPVMMLLQKSPPQGAYSSIFAATEPALELDQSKWGKLFFHCELFPESTAAKDEVAASKLWTLSEKLTGLSK